jgi:hypothetical protein
MWQMPTSPSGWKEIRLRLSRSSLQTIGYRPRLFNAELGLAQPKRTSDRGSALSGTGRWLAAVDPRARSWLQRHRFRIGIWAASFAFGRATVMEWIVLGFLLMHLLLLFGVLGGLLHTLFPRGCRNKSRGDRKGYSMQEAMPYGPDADLRKRGNQSPLFELDIWG